MPIPKSSPATLIQGWLPAFVLSILGSYILWEAYPGINWGLWTLGLVGVLVGLGYRESRRFTLFPLGTGGCAVVIAFGVSITTRPELQPLTFIAVWLLLALMVAYESFRDVRLRSMLLAPWRAMRKSALGAERAFVGMSHNISSPRAWPLVRGVIITLPIATILLLLLANADPTFALVQTTLSRVMPDVLFARILFGLVLFLVTLGMFGSVVYRDPTELLSDQAEPRRIPLGETECFILVGAVASIMWLFVMSATVSLFANPAAQAGTGVTYAEYARRGFAELSIAATLVVGVVLVVNHSSTPRNRRVQRFMFASLMAVVVILGLAFMRVIHYEMAYGYTTLRVYAQGYMLVLLVGICALMRDVLRPLLPRVFFPVIVGTALIAFTGALYWNTEAWVVHRNVDRYLTTGKIDTLYLEQLSLDAVPALDDRLNDLDPAYQKHFWDTFIKKNPKLAARPWFEWNLRRERAIAVYHKHVSR